MDTTKRTIVKAILWQFTGIVSMGLVGLLVTGSVSLGLGLAVVNAVVGLCCYIIYERLWARIGWERLQVQEKPTPSSIRAM